MIAPGVKTEIYTYGGYNSDEHMIIYVTVEKNGYSIVSLADSIYGAALTGSRCHEPFGFFSGSYESIVEELKKKGVIPAYFAKWKIDLKPDEVDALVQYDRNRGK